MKVTGAELQQFVDKGWPTPDGDWYWDHDLFEEIDPGATYETDEIGPILYQGNDPDPPSYGSIDLAAAIRSWRKVRDFDCFIITIKKSETETVRAALAAVGVKI